MMGETIPGAGFGPSPAASAPAPSRAPSSGEDGGFTLWDSDGFGFGDLLDVVNPLQHLPVISTVYRDLTGDDIGHAARVVGGGLFGGAIGAAASFANVLIDEATGDDLGGHMLALAKDATGIGGEPAPEDGPVMTADASGASPFAPEPQAQWTPSQQALANAVDEGDHLLVARQVRPGTMSEPGEWEWVRIPKHAGPTPQDAGEPLGNRAPAANPANPAVPPADPTAPDGGAPAPAGAAPDDPGTVQPPAAPAQLGGRAEPAPAGAVAAMAPNPAATGTAAGGAPDAGTASAPDAAPETPAPSAASAEGAAGQPADPLLAEAEKLFRLGLQYEPGADWARIGRDGADDGRDGDRADGDGGSEAAAPANPFDASATPAPGGDWVAGAMQEGLEKYRAMMGQQEMPGRPRLDVDL